MRVKSRFSAVLVIGLLAAALSACGDDDADEPRVTELSETTETYATPTTTEADEFGEGDVEAARIALEGVINRDLKDPAYRTEGFRSDPAVSPDLVAAINQLEDEASGAGAPGLGFDPFLCAQNVPTGVTFNAAGVAGDRVTFVGVFSFDGSKEKVTYVMAREPGGSWELDSTECLDAALPRGE